MVRPAIHKTTEAKIAAVREKRVRYYARHRDEILKRRRELRSSKSKEERAEAKFSKDLCKALAKALPTNTEDASESESDNDSHSHHSSESDEYQPSDLPECLLAIKLIKDQMLELIGNDPIAFTKDILLLYTESLLVDNCSTKGDVSIIENAMTKVQNLLDVMIPMQDQILNFCGISPEWHATDSVTRYLRMVLAYLEDILSLVLFEGASGLAEAQFLGELLYQKGIRI
ncbi:hypothetical protein P692DRAFT_20867217 [Suillus brevipes Sb2]|nr:hypothetical protein P692DRAFT_20867217 [Suillus brevipes Sb2]